MKKLLILAILISAVTWAAVRPTTVVEIAADMTSRLPGTYDTVFLLGVSSINDGNGGMFYWDAASTTAPDGLDVFQRDAGGTGRWKRIITPGGGGGSDGGGMGAMTLDDLYLLNPSTGNYIHFYITGADLSPVLHADSGGSGGTTNNYAAIWVTNSVAGGWTKIYINGGLDTNPQIYLSNGGSTGGTNNFYPFKLNNQTTTTSLTLEAIGLAASPSIQIQ